MQDFYDLKLERENTTGSKTATYEKTNPKGHILRVVGLPDLSQVRTMMLGVMNPNNSTGQDDAPPQTAPFRVEHPAASSTRPRRAPGRGGRADELAGS